MTMVLKLNNCTIYYADTSYVFSLDRVIPEYSEEWWETFFERRDR